MVAAVDGQIHLLRVRSVRILRPDLRVDETPLAVLDPLLYTAVEEIQVLGPVFLENTDFRIMLRQIPQPQHCIRRDIVVVLGEDGDQLILLRAEDRYAQIHRVYVHKALVDQLLVVDVHALSDIVDGQKHGFSSVLGGKQHGVRTAEISVELEIDLLLAGLRCLFQEEIDLFPGHDAEIGGCSGTPYPGI